MSNLVCCHTVTEFEAGLTNEAFQEQCFLWDGGVFVGADFDLFNFLDLSHAE